MERKPEAACELTADGADGTGALPGQLRTEDPAHPLCPALSCHLRTLRATRGPRSFLRFFSPLNGRVSIMFSSRVYERKKDVGFKDQTPESGVSSA